MLVRTSFLASLILSETGYPRFIDSYRIIYVGPMNRFSLALNLKFMGIYEVLLVSTLGTLIAKRLLAIWLFRSEIQEKSPVFNMISGCFGQKKFQRPKLISMVIVIVLFAFLVYINYVMQTGLMISWLTADPTVKFRSFESIRNSGIEIFTSKIDSKTDLPGQLKIG